MALEFDILSSVCGFAGDRDQPVIGDLRNTVSSSYWKFISGTIVSTFSG
jgi:hypothetical protein